MGFSWTKCQMFMWNHFSSFSSDGQHAEIVAGVRGARRLPAGVLEQLRGRLPAQTGEPGEQRLNGGLGQIPRCCQALCQPHHQAEVSQVYQNYIQNERFLNSFSFSFFFVKAKQGFLQCLRFLERCQVCENYQLFNRHTSRRKTETDRLINAEELWYIFPSSGRTGHTPCLWCEGLHDSRIATWGIQPSPCVFFPHS